MTGRCSAASSRRSRSSMQGSILASSSARSDAGSSPRDEGIMQSNGLDIFSLAGRKALVTGASGGLGAAVAIGLARAGADVVVHGEVAPADCDATCAAIRAAGVRAEAVAGDLSDPTTPPRLVSETIAALGGLDILVNNAGTIRRAKAEETSD